MSETTVAPFSLSGSFASTSNSASQLVFGNFSLTLAGTFSATVVLQKSPDGGTTWVPASTDGTGTDNSYTSPVAVAGAEEAAPSLYRLSCTYTSGTVDWFWAGSGRL